MHVLRLRSTLLKLSSGTWRHYRGGPRSGQGGDPNIYQLHMSSKAMVGTRASPGSAPCVRPTDLLMQIHSGGCNEKPATLTGPINLHGTPRVTHPEKTGPCAPPPHPSRVPPSQTRVLRTGGSLLSAKWNRALGWFQCIKDQGLEVQRYSQSDRARDTRNRFVCLLPHHLPLDPLLMELTPVVPRDLTLHLSLDPSLCPALFLDDVQAGDMRLRGTLSTQINSDRFTRLLHPLCLPTSVQIGFAFWKWALRDSGREN